MRIPDMFYKVELEHTEFYYSLQCQLCVNKPGIRSNRHSCIHGFWFFRGESNITLHTRFRNIKTPIQCPDFEYIGLNNPRSIMEELALKI